MKGFKVTYELVFLRNLKKILMEQAEKNGGAKETLDMMGPAFALSSNSSIDFSFDDFDEVKEHPMAN